MDPLSPLASMRCLSCVCACVAGTLPARRSCRRTIDGEETIALACYWSTPAVPAGLDYSETNGPFQVKGLRRIGPKLRANLLLLQYSSAHWSVSPATFAGKSSWAAPEKIRKWKIERLFNMQSRCPPQDVFQIKNRLPFLTQNARIALRPSEDSQEAVSHAQRTHPEHARASGTSARHCLRASR